MAPEIIAFHLEADAECHRGIGGNKGLAVPVGLVAARQQREHGAPVPVLLDLLIRE
jgi:hypothetical protein